MFGTSDLVKRTPVHHSHPTMMTQQVPVRTRNKLPVKELTQAHQCTPGDQRDLGVRSFQTARLETL